MRPRRLALLLATLTALAVDSAPAPAAEQCDRFAAPAGSDRGAGTAASPYRTAQRLVDALRAGETGCLGGGTYTDGGDLYVLDFKRAGITVRSAPGERARVVGIVMVRDSANRTRLAQLDIEGTGDSNTVKVYGDDVVVEDNDITNKLRGDSCMIIGSPGGGRALRTSVRRNRFRDCGSPKHDNRDHSIYAAKSTDGQILENVFVNSAAKSIQLYPDAQSNRVAHNVIDGGPDTVRGGIVIGGDTRSTSNDNVVEHNIVTHAADYSIYSNWQGRTGRRNIVRHNCTFNAGDREISDAGGLILRNNITANPGTGPCRQVVGRRAAALLGDLPASTLKGCAARKSGRCRRARVS